MYRGFYARLGQRHRTQRFQSSMYHTKAACEEKEGRSDWDLREGAPTGESKLGSADWRLYRRRTWIKNANWYSLLMYQ